jgi:hypothetical protein
MAVYCWSGRQPRCIAFQFGNFQLKSFHRCLKFDVLIPQHQYEVGDRFGISPGKFNNLLSRWAIRCHEYHRSF